MSGLSGIDVNLFYACHSLGEQRWDHQDQLALAELENWDKIDLKLDRLKQLLSLLSHDRIDKDGKEVKQLDYSKSDKAKALIDEVRTLLNEGEEVEDQFLANGVYCWSGSKVGDLMEHLNEQSKSLNRKLNMVIMKLTDIKQKQNLLPEMMLKIEQRCEKSSDHFVRNQRGNG